MPDWVPIMLAACLASFLIGWIIAWIADHWNDR
jgi:hypothetical protein